jgi:hypothetical protein
VSLAASAEGSADVPFEAKLPEGMPALKIDTGDERYKQLEALATAQKWTQEAFSSVLGIEARRVMASAPAAAPAAKVDFSKMPVRDQIHHALERSAAKRNGG